VNISDSVKIFLLAVSQSVSQVDIRVAYPVTGFFCFALAVSVASHYIYSQTWDVGSDGYSSLSV
jgi:hypothetical protein